MCNGGKLIVYLHASLYLFYHCLEQAHINKETIVNSTLVVPIDLYIALLHRSNVSTW